MFTNFGYIINDNEGYSVCSSKGCKYNSNLNGIPSKCEVDGNGGIVKEETTNNKKEIKEELKFCNNDSSVSITAGKYYSININVKDSYPETTILDKLIVEIKDNIVFTVVTDGYILIGNNDVIVETAGMSKINKLYECNSKTRSCKSIENELKTYGYYRNAVSEEVIICNEGGCDICGVGNCEVEFSNDEQIVTKKFVEKGKGFYEGISYIAVTGKYKENMLLANNYILLNEGNISKLYHCYEKSGKCEIQGDGDKPYPGWYISGDEINKAYKCDKRTCKAEQLKGSCTNSAGELIFNSNNNIYQICIPESISLNENAGVIKTINSDKFPGGKKVILINSNSVIGIGDKVEDGNQLVIKDCSKPDASSSYCYGSGVIKKKEGDEWKESIEGEKGKVVLLKGNTLAESNDIDKIGTRMYYCDRNKSCRVTQGYYKGESGWYKCDNIKCSVINADSSSVVGDLNKNGELKLGNGDTGNYGSNKKPKYYYINENNIFPGAESSESVLIEAGEDYFVVFKGEGYYLVNGRNNEIEDETRNSTGTGTSSKRAQSVNALYLCTSEDMTCKKVEERLNGYYINGATANQSEAIIVCKETGEDVVCGIEDVDEAKKTCSEAGIGKLIIDSSKNSKNIKICTSKTESQTLSSGELVKYYNVTIAAGNEFGGISIRETAVNDKANILIRVDDKSIVQYTDKGYILYSTRWESTEGSRRNLQAVLSYCDKKVYTGSSKTVQCHAVIDIRNGWYFSEINKDNSFIECTTTSTSSSGQCVLKQATMLEECQSSGSIIYNDNKFKMCETLKKQVEIPLEGKGKSYKSILRVSAKDQFPGVGTNGSNIIVEVDNYSVRMIPWEGYQVVDEESKRIVEEVTEEGKGIFTKAGLLYKCEANGGCEKIGLPRKNWYLKKNVDKLADGLIYCKKDDNNVNPSGSRCVVNTKPTAGFYVSSDKKKPIIQCIQTGLKENGVFVTENNKILCYEREMKEGWMLNSRVAVEEGEKDLSYMINCSQENGCQEVKGVNNGWYMNAGYSYNIEINKNNDIDSNNYYPIIQCTSNGCSAYKEDFSDKCSKGGEIIYSSKKYKLCLSSTATDSVKFEEVTGKDSQVVKIENYGDFPDASPDRGYILVEITKNEIQQIKYEDKYIHYILKDKNMYKCEGNGCSLITGESNDDKTVWEELSLKLYTASSCSSTGCKWSYIYTEEAITFLDDNRKIKITRSRLQIKKLMYKQWIK